MHISSTIFIFTLFVAAFAGQTASKQGGTAATPPKTTTKVKLSLDDIKFAVYKSNETPSSTSIKINTKDTKVHEVDKNEKVHLTFDIKDENTKQSILVQQAFIAFVHKETGREVIFIAEPQTGTKTYLAEIDMKSQGKTFGHLDGLYNIRLIIGDATAVNSIDWNFADVKIHHASPIAANPSSGTTVKKSQIVNYDSLPEIKHHFREPEKRPPQLISDAFTILCLAPMAILIIMWLTIGVNFNNVQISLWSLGFHAGLSGILGLYFVFWCHLDMFETIKYLALIAVPTFICGNKLLRSLNETRRNAKAE